MKNDEEHFQKYLDDMKDRLGTIEKAIIPLGIANIPAISKAIKESAENNIDTAKEEKKQ